MVPSANHQMAAESSCEVSEVDVVVAATLDGRTLEVSHKDEGHGGMQVCVGEGSQQALEMGGREGAEKGECNERKEQKNEGRTLRKSETRPGFGYHNPDHLVEDESDRCKRRIPADGN
ncbi:hypothetical protein NDU88_008464 [Pleurodeles waltl]|uniref:Uncharacterized protein n=1 Tax=Pleurodeles waltl TaxID=8319 RepID=A0AAV7PW93_PLEWA|nr:hypothetical protein NDU88_008464 [Pleurodeles waltl]